jgi:beta-glucosidase-like glycosyl hydrolase
MLTAVHTRPHTRSYCSAALIDPALKAAKYNAAVDVSVQRILTPMFQLGIMDKPNNNKIDTNVSNAESMIAARQLSEQATELLKNNGNLLPLVRSSV